jgi:hypothetical protein
VHVVVEVEVVIGRPRVVDLEGGVPHAGAGAAHLLDDGRRVADEEIVVVERIGEMVEHRLREGHGGVEPRRVHADAVFGAGRRIARTVEARAGMDEREVHVEEHGADGRGGVPHAAGPLQGPATTTTTRAGSRSRRATARRRRG